MSGNVINIFSKFFNKPIDKCRTVSGWRSARCNFQNASKFLATFKIKYSPEKGKVFGGTISKVSTKSISQETFKLRDDECQGEREISVYDYYVDKYGRSDLNPDGICLIVNTKIQVPAEICEIKEHQSINKKLSTTQTDKMLNLAKKAPHVLQYEIERAIDDLNLRKDPILKEFGVSFAKDVSMHPIPKARVLAAPLICYGKNASGDTAFVIPEDGVWDNWKSRAQFLEPRSLSKDKWGILYTCDGNGDERKFVDLLTQKAKFAGLTMNKPASVKDLSDRLDDSQESYDDNVAMLKGYFAHLKEQNYKVVVVVLTGDGSGSHLYGQVKQAAELDNGILTQCVSTDVFTNPKPAEIANILLKMNNKLGGINHVVMAPFTALQFSLFDEPVMVLGADVTHPPPRPAGEAAGESLSYAAVISSTDRTGMRYTTQVKAQTKAGKNAAEVIQGFKAIIKESLKAFYRKCKQKPTKIVYYRDGVGNGQFQQLLHEEMRQIREACTELTENYEPKITFITVQKRHNTRFFFQEDGKTKNAPAGTIVDTDIVHPTEMDSFLLSHRSIMGTSRPTHYHVLWDDSDFTEDQIQQMTYYLCHMYARCNRAVSIPAPTYYAHHGATRAKVLAEGLSGTVEEINTKLQRTEIYKTNPMHFV